MPGFQRSQAGRRASFASAFTITQPPKASGLAKNGRHRLQSATDHCPSEISMIGDVEPLGPVAIDAAAVVVHFDRMRRIDGARIGQRHPRPMRMRHRHKGAGISCAPGESRGRFPDRPQATKPGALAGGEIFRQSHCQNVPETRHFPSSPECSSAPGMVVKSSVAECLWYRRSG